MIEYYDIRVTNLTKEQIENCRKIIQMEGKNCDEVDHYLSIDISNEQLFFYDQHTSYNSKMITNFEDFISMFPKITTQYAKVTTKLGDVL